MALINRLLSMRAKTATVRCICGLLLVMLWSHGLFAADELSGKLPRSFGSVVLGMPVTSFKKMFNLQPSGCATCEKGEQSASFYLDKNEANYFGKKPTIVKDLQNGKLTYLPTSFKPKVVHCYFYAGKLYLITFSGIRSKLATIQDNYINKLGKPTGVDVWDTGISQLRWENASTRLSVVYHTAEKDLDEFDITYADVSIMSKMPDDTAH